MVSWIAGKLRRQCGAERPTRWPPGYRPVPPPACPGPPWRSQPTGSRSGRLAEPAAPQRLSPRHPRCVPGIVHLGQVVERYVRPGVDLPCPLQLGERRAQVARPMSSRVPRPKAPPRRWEPPGAPGPFRCARDPAVAAMSGLIPRRREMRPRRVRVERDRSIERLLGALAAAAGLGEAVGVEPAQLQSTAWPRRRQMPSRAPPLAPGRPTDSRRLAGSAPCTRASLEVELVRLDVVGGTLGELLLFGRRPGPRPARRPPGSRSATGPRTRR